MNHANYSSTLPFSMQELLNFLLKLVCWKIISCLNKVLTYKFNIFLVFLNKIYWQAPQIVVLYMRSQLLKLIAIYFDGPLAQLAEHLTFNQVVRSSNLRWLTIICGPMVNRLRHRPFTAEWGVRLSYGSPLKVYMLE